MDILETTVNELFDLFNGHNADPAMFERLDDMTDEEITALADAQHEANDDSDVEGYIFVHFLVYCNTSLIQYMDRSIIRAKEWAAIATDSFSEIGRRLEISDKLSTIKSIQESLNR
ncbi:hypothetical protein H072_3960 [Dactylellina haptotyla CBS 200.50]|uniref:Uncharacterized protein n=1 Tax=Dactylellina haptotyla (strain CBS 200.50) TaxID=1284197 RepID=S8C366_DACHA|nr:hypothetical protein H072_3960 [Dactylellina haptotyla CBS 200.50]